MKRVFLIVAIFIFGCVALQEDIPEQEIDSIIKETVFQHSFDKVWSTIIEVLSDESIPIASIEKVSGLVTSDFMSITVGRVSQIAMMKKDGGYRQVNTFFITNARYKLNVFVSSLDSTRTKVKITPHIEGFFKFGDLGGGWQVAVSRGRLEKEIFNAIMQKLEPK